MFQGNEEMYTFWGEANMIAASFIMPANKGVQAVSQAKNATSAGQKAVTFVRAAGTEVGKDLVNGALSTGVGYGVTELTENQELGMAAGVLSSFAFGAELDAIDESLNISGLSRPKTLKYDIKGKGAYNGDIYDGNGFGTLCDKELNVSRKGIDIIKEHLSGEFSTPYNDAMIARLEEALANNKKITGADAIFYTHEIAETTMMNNGMDYYTAHSLALEKYDVSPFSVYHPDVIKEYSPYFNNNWKNFWGIK